MTDLNADICSYLNYEADSGDLLLSNSPAEHSCRVANNEHSYKLVFHCRNTHDLDPYTLKI
jgi:hypothetical protein